MSEYTYWRHYGPDLSPLGVIRGAIDPDNRYFCTPVGAVVFGWAGVDGIHYCKIRRFRDMIFAVSPANAPGEYVHPIAKDFRDFLRLLITLGDANLIEQAWMWDRSRFIAERKRVSAAPDPARDAVIAKLTKKFSLAPMEDPYTYIRTLQEHFDYTTIPFDPSFLPECLPKLSPSELPWHVVCAPGFFPTVTRQQRSTEYPLRLPFSLALFDSAPIGAEILSYYICHTGMVIDLFLENTDQTRALIPYLTANGRAIHAYSGCVCTNLAQDSSDTEPDPETAAVFAHYRLSDRRGQVCRFCFLWKDGGWRQEPALKTCALTLSWEPHFRDAVTFSVHGPGEAVPFTDLSGTAHTLTVVGWDSEDVSLPAHSRLYTRALRYTIDPPLAKETYALADVSVYDKDAVQLAICGDTETKAAAIGIIGGADGPTAILLSSPEPDIVFSGVHAEPFDRADWCLRLLEPESPPETVVLLSSKKETPL